MKRNTPKTDPVADKQTAAVVKPSHEIYRTILVIALIAVIVVMNTVIYGLAKNNSWYFYASEPLEHTIGRGTYSYVREVAEKGQVRIIFCDTQENLEGDQVFNLVWQTAHQFAAAHPDFVSVDDPVNIFTDPELVEPYKYETNEDGSYVLVDGERKKINEINRYSVIIAGEKDFAVLPMQSFFVLDEDQIILSYTGEEVFAAMIHRVQTASTFRPTAYFTESHGESYSSALMNRLICAGYNIESVDFVKGDIPYSEGNIVVISNPRYDFTRGMSGVMGELDKLDAFLNKGGSVFAMLDPVITGTVKLEEFLSSWGITVMRAETDASPRDTVMVHDSANSITTDGYALITEIAREGIGEEIGAAMDAIDAGRVIISRASPLVVSSPEGKSVTPLLISSRTSAAMANGETIDSEGRYPVAALSRDERTGGGVFAVSSVYFTTQSALTTNEYGNRDLIFYIVGELCDISVPTGGTHLLFEETAVEDLTMWEARLWTVLLCVVLPLSVAVAGTVILIKRRNR